MRLRQLGQTLGIGESQTTMKVRGNIHARSGGLPRGAEAISRRLQCRRGDSGCIIPVALYLKAVRPRESRRSRNELIESSAVARVDSGIHPNPIAHAPAEQLVDGDPERLSENVPERHVDAGKRGTVDRTAMVESTAVEMLPEIFDAPGILTDQSPAHLTKHRLYGERCSLERGLTETGQTRVGMHAHDQPTRAHVKRFKSRDFYWGELAQGAWSPGSGAMGALSGLSGSCPVRTRATSFTQ